MRTASLILAGSAALFVAVTANSVGHAKGAPPPKPVGTAAEIVEGRQATFLLSGALFGTMKGAIDRGEDVKGQAFAARSIARWAKALPGMFPKGTGIAPSAALPNIWTDRAGFEAKAASYAAEADKLAAFATANDKAGFAAQWAVVRGTCGACHDVYRKPEEKKP